MNTIGYVRWCGRALIREPLAWAMAVIVLGFVAAATGCPDPWPVYTAVLGGVIMIIYALRIMLQASYQRYQREQQETLEELRRK